VSWKADGGDGLEAVSRDDVKEGPRTEAKNTALATEWGRLGGFKWEMFERALAVNEVVM
jgi:hypothetical protein